MMITLACMAAALLTRGVTVESAVSANDEAAKFAAKDLERILKDVPGRIVLREESALRPQEWRLKSSGDGALVISGRDGMGIVYGVCSFLEKHAGVRWFAPDTECVPDLKGWTLPANLDETGKPAFDYREMFVGADFMDGLWRLRNKESNRALFGCGVHNGSPGDCHTFAAYSKALKAAHPELFGKRLNASGQVATSLCPSDETTRRFVADEMCRHIEADAAKCAGKPRYCVPTFYDLSQDDGGSSGECMCDRCAAARRAAGSYSGPNILFASAVAELVRKRHPEVTVQTFAYSYTQEPPTNDVVAAENVNVRYCCSWVFDPLVKGSPQGDRLEAWSRHAKQFGIWSYWRTYRGVLFPFVKKRAEIAAEIRFCAGLGATRYFAEDESPLARSFAMMQHWLFLKLTEDPAQDEGKAASEVYPQLATSSVLGSVDAGTLGKWAKAKSVDFTEFMDAPGSFEDAFLLDCAVSEVEDKKAEFRFAEIVPGVTPTIGEGGRYGNGKVVVYGMAELGAGGEWEPADDDSRFFKAKLVPVRYDENLSDRIGDLQGGGV